VSQVQQLPTSGIVKSRLGEIELKNGYPTEASVKKIYNDLDFQRACQAYLWALPLMAMHQWQGEQREKFGAKNLSRLSDVTQPQACIEVFGDARSQIFRWRIGGRRVSQAE
jgi:hypothetical protein